MKDLNELGLKDITLNFDTGELDDIQLVQGDTKTRGFNVELVSNSGEVIAPGSNITLKLFGTNLNDPTKTYYTVANVIDGKYQVFFSTDMLGKMGKVEFQLALYQGTDKLIQSNTYISDVTKSLCNGGATGKDLVVDFTKLEKALERVDIQEKAYKDSLQKQEVIKADIDSKQKQVSTDTTEVRKIRTDMEGVMDAEESRVEAEKKRVSQEKGRESAEKDRNSQENNRIEAEKDRQNFELERAKAETARVSAENSRASAEKDRQSQESTRETNEDKRKSAENSRVSAEDTRESQEKTRQSQETQRVEAENKRKSTFEGWDLAMQGVIPNATADKAGVVKVAGLGDEETPYTVYSTKVIDDKLEKVKFQLPRLKIGEDTSKIPNDSYYIETNEMNFSGNLSDKKILAIGERDFIKHDNIQKLKDKNGLLIGSKGDFVGETIAIIGVEDFANNFPGLFEKYLKKDFSDYIIVFGTEFDTYAKYPQYFETIKALTGSRNFVHVFDPEIKASLDEVSYDDNISLMEMVSEDPKIEYKFIRAFRGGDILRYKDKDGKIH